MSLSDILSAQEADQFLREALIDAAEGRTEAAIRRAASELADLKLSAAMWGLWKEGQTELRISEEGELRWKEVEG